MCKKIVPVILAGGKGTRLWPYSRSSMPKQFIRLLDDHTLFQKALLRVADPDLYEPPVIVTHEDFRFLVAEQSRIAGINKPVILLEPSSRNTAPAIAAAALVSSDMYGEDAVLQIFAADHDIDTGRAYHEAVESAYQSAIAGKIVTFGITPDYPATGYGYIKAGKTPVEGAFAVEKFVEKPDAKTAQRMLIQKRYYWNSGLFMGKVSAFVRELRVHASDILDAAQCTVTASKCDVDFIRLDPESFSKSPAMSFDYAVMEKTNHASVVPSDFSWCDLGSWDQVWKHGPKDAQGNLTSGNTNLVDTSNSLILTQGMHVCVQGMSDIAVVASEDAVYIGKLADSQELGPLVQQLADNPKTIKLTQEHQTSLRPWGGYSILATGDNCKIKKLFVLPGQRLSLQKHHHRSEHWMVIKGTADITIGNDQHRLHENEMAYIPAGEVHRLSNPGHANLELVEIQTGCYLEEDDIIRIQDDFGRAP